MATTCSVGECRKPVLARTWCAMHYGRWRSHGDPVADVISPGSRQAAFDQLVLLETDDCVIWPYGKTKAGYGLVGPKYTKAYTHVRALEARTGPRPAGMEAAHGPCHNPACMNYRHLRWATPTENNADRIRDDTSNRGERNGHARLTAEQVRAIRSQIAEQTPSQVVALRFGVNDRTVRNIASRQSWAWLD